MIVKVLCKLKKPVIKVSSLIVKKSPVDTLISLVLTKVNTLIVAGFKLTLNLFDDGSVIFNNEPLTVYYESMNPIISALV